MVPKLRVVIDVHTMDHNLHMLTAYVDSRLSEERNRKLLIFIFTRLATGTIGSLCSSSVNND
jgi:hypothetical protein